MPRARPSAPTFSARADPGPRAPGDREVALDGEASRPVSSGRTARERNVIGLARGRTLSSTFFRISPRSLSVSGLIPPSPSRTSNERGSACSSIVALTPSPATSTVASQCVTSSTRSWPTFAATPSRWVLTWSDALPRPSRWLPAASPTRACAFCGRPRRPGRVDAARSCDPHRRCDTKGRPVRRAGSLVLCLGSRRQPRLTRARGSRRLSSSPTCRRRRLAAGRYPHVHDLERSRRAERQAEAHHEDPVPISSRHEDRHPRPASVPRVGHRCADPGPARARRPRGSASPRAG